MDNELIEKLEKLATLKKNGVITQDEFDDQKRKLFLNNVDEASTKEKSEKASTDQIEITKNDQLVNFNRNIIKLCLFVAMIGFIGYLIYSNPGINQAKEMILDNYIDPDGGPIDIGRAHCINIFVSTICFYSPVGGGRAALFATVANDIYNSYFMVFLIALLLYIIFAIPYNFGKKIFMTDSEIQKFQPIENNFKSSVSQILNKLNSPIGIVIMIILAYLLVVYG